MTSKSASESYLLGLGTLVVLLSFWPFLLLLYILGKSNEGAKTISDTMIGRITTFDLLGFLPYKKRRNQYVKLIRDQNHSSADRIASILNLSDINLVMSEIQSVIDDGLLPGYSLDPATRVISKVSSGSESMIQAKEPVVFTCKSCGANNSVIATGGIVKCEFCDAPNES
ncbi:MAG: hypothetical protein HYU36_02715 [Planctomycetes bacterium]|nr:hypothetical protein [Planctomycetota bacterium]